MRGIYGFKNVEAYEIFVGEVSRLAREVENLEPVDVEWAADKLIEENDRRPLPSAIKVALVRARDHRLAEQRLKTHALSAAPGDDEAALIAINWILDSKMRGKKFAGVQCDSSGMITDTGAKEVIATLSETALGYVDGWIKQARGAGKLDPITDHFAYDLRFMLKTQRGATEGRLGDYRRLTAGLRG